MAGASISVYEFDNMVRGQHVYKSAWTPLIDKTRKRLLREDNEHEMRCKQSTVSASKRRMHTSKEISRIS